MSCMFVPSQYKDESVPNSFLSFLAQHEHAQNQARIQQRIQRDRAAQPGMTIDRAVTGTCGVSF